MRDIDVVVNFDFPQTIADYVHRIGRTGRAGSKGFALTLVSTSDEKHLLKGLIKVMSDSDQVIPQELDELANAIPLKEEKVKKK